MLPRERPDEGKSPEAGWERTGSGELKGTCGKQGVKINGEAIGIGEYQLPGARAIALEKNVRAGAGKRRCKEPSSDVGVVCNPSEGQRDQAWTRSNEDHLGVELGSKEANGNWLLDCFEGEKGSHDSFTPGFMHLTH